MNKMFLEYLEDKNNWEEIIVRIPPDLLLLISERATFEDVLKDIQFYIFQRNRLGSAINIPEEKLYEMAKTAIEDIAKYDAYFAQYYKVISRVGREYLETLDKNMIIKPKNP